MTGPPATDRPMTPAECEEMWKKVYKRERDRLEERSRVLEAALGQFATRVEDQADTSIPDNGTLRRIAEELRALASGGSFCEIDADELERAKDDPGIRAFGEAADERFEASGLGGSGEAPAGLDPTGAGGAGHNPRGRGAGEGAL